MVFKNNWEKSEESHNLPTHIFEDMVALIYPAKNLLYQELISGGCANLNIKIYLSGDHKPYILRIYLRDKDSAFREQKLCDLLKERISVPVINHVANYGEYRFAMVEFIPGITLRELLLSNEPHSVGTIMYEVGLVLSKITAQGFNYSGFFDKHLNIISKKPDENYLDFAKECLKNQMVLKHLDANVVLKINLLLDQLINFLPSGNEKNLVHGDFDPANIDLTLTLRTLIC